jgi:hypothetical protein
VNGNYVTDRFMVLRILFALGVQEFVFHDGSQLIVVRGAERT